MTTEELIDTMRRSFQLCCLVRAFDHAEWQYLRLRYGLDGKRRHHPREVQMELGLSEDGLEQIEHIVNKTFQEYLHECETGEIKGSAGANKCENCRFWKRYFAEDSDGICRIRRPLIDDRGNTIWPETREDDWCGEFESKGDEQ